MREVETSIGDNPILFVGRKSLNSKRGMGNKGYLLYYYLILNL